MGPESLKAPHRPNYSFAHLPQRRLDFPPQTKPVPPEVDTSAHAVVEVKSEPVLHVCVSQASSLEIMAALQDENAALLRKIQQMKSDHLTECQHLKESFDREKVLWKDEVTYLQDEIQALEEAFKKMAIEKAKMHQLYTTLNNASSTTSTESPNKNFGNSISLLSPTPPSTISGSSTPVTDFAEPFDRPISFDRELLRSSMCGWLKVAVAENSVPVDRWVCIRDDMLCLYMDSSAPHPVAGFWLQNYTIDRPDIRKFVYDGVNTMHPFRVTSSDKLLTYVFFTESNAEVEQWVSSLQQLISPRPEQALVDSQTVVLDECQKYGGVGLRTKVSEVFAAIERRRGNPVKDFFMVKEKRSDKTASESLSHCCATPEFSTDAQHFITITEDPGGKIDTPKCENNSLTLKLLGERVRGLKLLKHHVDKMKQNTLTPTEILAKEDKAMSLIVVQSP